MATTLTNEYQVVARIPLTYGELRTYARVVDQSTWENRTNFSVQQRYYTSQPGGVSIGSSSLTTKWLKNNQEIDNQSVSLGYTTFAYNETLIAEKSILVNHNTDGTPPTIKLNTSWYASYGGSGSSSTEVTFPKIDRLSRTDTFVGETITTDLYDLEGNFSATYTNYVSTYTQKLRISIPAVQMLMKIDNYESGTQVQLDTASLNYIKNYMNTNKTANVTIEGSIETWNGNTRISDTGSERRINIICAFRNANPTLTYTKQEQNQNVISVLGSSSATTIIKNASQLDVVVVPTAEKGSIISSVSVTTNGQLQTKTSSPYEFTLNMVTNNFIISVADIRGNVTNQTIEMTLLDYIPIRINNFEFKREYPTSNDIVVKLNSEYLQETYNNVPNVPLVQWKLGEEGTLTTIPATEYSIDTTNNKLKLNGSTLTNALSYRNKGTFYIYVSDLFTSANDSMEVIKGIPTFDAGEHDLCVNGTLYVADEDRENKIDVLTKYSTTEKPIGYWTDGEIIYQKVVDTGQIASTSKNVAHLISNLGNVIRLYGMAKSSGGTYCTLPRTSSAFANQIEIQANSTNIVLQVGSSANFASSFVVIEYTKSS